MSDAGVLNLDASIAVDVTRPADEVIEMIAHCSATIAAAQYRMMHLINRLNDLRSDEWLADVADRFTDDPAAQLTPNGTEQTNVSIAGSLPSWPIDHRCLVPPDAQRRLPIPYLHHSPTPSRYPRRRLP